MSVNVPAIYDTYVLPLMGEVRGLKPAENSGDGSKSSKISSKALSSPENP